MPCDCQYAGVLACAVNGTTWVTVTVPAAAATLTVWFRLLAVHPASPLNRITAVTERLVGLVRWHTSPPMPTSSGPGAAIGSGEAVAGAVVVGLSVAAGGTSGTGGLAGTGLVAGFAVPVAVPPPIEG